MYKRLYDGWALRNNVSNQFQFKKLKYNPARPIANIGADFLASKPISFWVPGNDEATEKCKEIWSCSGAEGAFLETAILGGIMGDAAVMLSKGEDDDCVKLKWIDPSICTPIFSPHDYDKLDGMIFTYGIPQVPSGEKHYREEWKDGKITIMEDDEMKPGDTYDQKKFGGLPMEWIRNQRVKGECFGRSDIDVVELVEQYDHLCDKQSRILDYYASPNMYAKGVPKGKLDITKGERTVYHLPADGEIGFIEWHGSQQSMDVHLNRIKENISEMTETPQVAFSKIDAGLSDVSGVALKLLFQPLLSKTNRKRASWGQALIRIMQKALLVEGIEVDVHDIGIMWQSPLPSNDLEDWQISTLKSTLGVSKRQVLREHGYTDEQINKMTGEIKVEVETAPLDPNKVPKQDNASKKGTLENPNPGSKPNSHDLAEAMVKKNQADQ
jgi:hypothetical protein